MMYLRGFWRFANAYILLMLRRRKMNLYISDLHFGHANVINFDHRPFSDVEEMDRMQIKFWNSRGQQDDHVYIIGDFCYRNERPEEWYLRQLKGHKHLIIGNHDQNLVKNDKAMSYLETVDKMMLVQEEDKRIVLCHYPLCDWYRKASGSWHIYGHIHKNKDDVYDFIKRQEKALNAGCMINNYAPVSLNEMVRNNELFKNRK